MRLCPSHGTISERLRKLLTDLFLRLQIMTIPHSYHGNPSRFPDFTEPFVVCGRLRGMELQIIIARGKTDQLLVGCLAPKCGDDRAEAAFRAAQKIFPVPFYYIPVCNPVPVLRVQRGHDLINAPQTGAVPCQKHDAFCRFQLHGHAVENAEAVVNLFLLFLQFIIILHGIEAGDGKGSLAKASGFLNGLLRRDDGGIIRCGGVQIEFYSLKSLIHNCSSFFHSIDKIGGQKYPIEEIAMSPKRPILCCIIAFVKRRQAL